MTEIDTAAPALVTEATVAETTEAIPEAEPDYEAAFDRASGEKAEEPEAAEPEAQEEPEPEETVGDAVDPAPSDLPKGVKDAWASLTAEAREAVAKSHREMTQKLSEQGRMVQGISPIRDALVEASKASPHLLNMTPAQVAKEVMELARVSADFNSKPVETMLGLVKKHGLEAAMMQALSGQGITQDTRQNAALQNEVRALQQQLARVADPEYIRENFAQFSAQDRAIGDVQAFADTAEHWAAVEPYLLDVIPLVQKQLGEGASAKDVLARAYELALSIYAPDMKAKPQPAVEAQAVIDPKKAEAVLKAKSVNVTSRPNGQMREMSEDDRLAAVYDRVARK